MSKTQDKPAVRFAVDNDEDANRIAAILEALGYSVRRDLDRRPDEDRFDWLLARMSKLFKLTDREQLILAGILQGRAPEEIADDMGISRATVKWHSHNVFAKAGIKVNGNGREGLLLFAMHELGALPSRPPLRVVEE